MTEQNPRTMNTGTAQQQRATNNVFVLLLSLTEQSRCKQWMSMPRQTATTQKPAPRHVLMEQSNGKDSNNVSRGSGGTKTGSGGSRMRTSSGSQNENPRQDSTGSNRSIQNKKQRTHVDAQHTSGARQGKSSTPVRSSAGYSSHPSQAGPPKVTQTHVHPTTTTSNSTPVQIPSGTPNIPTRTNSFLQHLASTPQSFQGFQSGDSPKTSSVPDAICGNANEVSSVVTETNNASLYEQDKRDNKKEHEQRMRQLKEYVRNSLFPYWKFFSNKKQMVFSNQEGGIVLKICSELHVRPDSQMYWWDLNKKSILEALNRKRNDVTAYLKKHFCGKTLLDLCESLFNHSVTKLLILTYEIF